jgi:hypothetical protein
MFLYVFLFHIFCFQFASTARLTHSVDNLYFMTFVMLDVIYKSCFPLVNFFPLLSIHLPYLDSKFVWL